MERPWILRLSGIATGVVNGLFGGGGGMVLLPMLSSSLSSHQLFATCVAIIFPVCSVSAAAYLLSSALSLSTALPYLIGGFLGGLVGGRLFHTVPPTLLKAAFAIFLLYAGVRYLL